jgi:hypothetical protein
MNYENEITDIPEPNLHDLERKTRKLNRGEMNCREEQDETRNELLFAITYELRLIRITLNEILEKDSQAKPKAK